VNPEREFGERFASQLLHEGVMGELMLGEDLIITELRTPLAFVGRSIESLSITKRFGVTIVAVRRHTNAKVVIPEGKEKLENDDVLIVVSKPGAVSQMMERV